MVEKGMRVGINSINHRFSVANNRRIETYGPSFRTRTLLYQNSNALYSWAMCQMLPFKFWVDIISPGVIDILNIPFNNLFGYIVVVNLEYPRKLYDEDNLYPLAPEYLLFWMKCYHLSKKQYEDNCVNLIPIDMKK